MFDDDKGKETKRHCDHEWRAVGESHLKTHVQLICVKCGEKREIEQFPLLTQCAEGQLHAVRV